VARGNAEIDPLSERGHGEAALRLKFSNDLPINRVHRRNHCRDGAISAEICNKAPFRLKYFSREESYSAGGWQTNSGEFLDYAPIAATAFSVPQFVPQLIKLRATNDTAGVSWSWAALTSVNNAGWLVYFALSGFWTALVPASSATLLAGALATMLALRGQAKTLPAVLIGAWATLLAVAVTVAGRAGLGTLLTAAFVLQVTPSIWTAYRTPRPTGISRGTWVLIFAELACWTSFGLHKSDPRLTTLGLTGVTASVLMLARIRRTTGTFRPTAPGRAI
jgi:uncharacterized protein with PQ loop repeat